ncbi:glycine cleavage system protein GcvH [Acidiferrobacter thiooxydans]|jgi:glycine cleavage system H protein|uniref:Glycine cleavage system H protein n=1 Tax=Acidiferrobacter thiooxydans TaxID=163359 RepID=A0A1C2G4U7_9GAMM|nr:glycine cleavage system protein GcvH [Acidiferrobacter thiooxydans]MDA8192222.1 glycine cleavage system protein GcvH [Gammaproteobacteria bacterium]RCN56890.1 glycine cleavage system protein H [Acidiferrobacter thiooxydans]UEN99583.1 glycine cleavage system protein GcvH [Acidiferrobacter thiooxydans]
MSKVPADLHYTKSHEWVREDGMVLVVGITDHAQDLMGDMVFVELPKPGTRVDTGKECAVVESVKAASDVYAPVAGEVTAINEALADAPETLNADPYGNGWLFKIKPADPGAVRALLDASAYETLLASEA